MAHSWKALFEQRILKDANSKQDIGFAEKYVTALTTSYTEQQSLTEAIQDFKHIRQLSTQNPLITDVFAHTSKEYPYNVKLYSLGDHMPLSDILPTLENMGLRTYTEQAYKITIDKHKIYWISEFNVTCAQKNQENFKAFKGLFNDALIHISKGACENDGLNKLVLSAGLSWSEIVIIRAYSKYMQQIGIRYSQAFIENTLYGHAEVVKKLVDLFYMKFDLNHKPTRKKKKVDILEHSIQLDIDGMSNLDEDHIFRFFLILIKATLRTNYFQRTSEGNAKDYLSIKIHTAILPDLPPGQPLYEIFVYAPRFEGIHLRSSKVARGGIRWSERTEDYRVEILDLMKAQKVKNSVIVPSGAKGGFILKKISNSASIKQEVIDCYKLFIQGLLDLTDNLVDDQIIAPKNTVCYDDPDPYLVVAADKGTATFSDLANGLSQQYNFWLGDAFASGGSVGYDHKKMGITARGTWESIKQHFRELDIDCEACDFTVAGIGDMSGDVFGNGLIYTEHALLIAAFDHRHIFIDPNPSSAKAFEERVRLFNLPASSWADYNPACISEGGGIYSRSAKSIKLSSDAKKALAITKDILSPNELVQAILKAPVDLLFNGGIGTYVKASTESRADIGDKINEFCRINANELSCKMVGEGGNLGFTQMGRVEYALSGGRINTDSIDNSAGVNCSDHEVNIKIMLNKKMLKGELTRSKRNQLLKKMTQQVADLVLKDNYNQALTLGFSVSSALEYSGLYQAYLKALEGSANLDRAAESLPDDKKLLERKTAEKGLTRPELAIIMSYTKIYITNELLKSTLPDDSYLNSMLETGFPEELKKNYLQSMQQHPLRREIIATQLSNQIVNRLGITFMYRMSIETGQSIADIARAYTIASKSFQMDYLHLLIDSLTQKVPLNTQYELLHYVRQLMNLATRWFLRNKRFDQDIAGSIAHYTQALNKLEPLVPDLMAGVTKEYYDTVFVQFINLGLPKKAANKIALTRVLYTILNITEVATQHSFELVLTAKLYFALGRRFHLVWFRDQIAKDSREGHWNSLSRLSLRAQLDNLQRSLTILILKQDHKTLDIEKLINGWFTANPFVQLRWEQLIEMLMDSSNIDYIKFFIALWELSILIDAEHGSKK
ncbi:MAG: NAD-glutamate dehydrogenase [Legionella sp.]|nr:NAD-glutamate dehydrogenase [Legionella sp.]